MKAGTGFLYLITPHRCKGKQRLSGGGDMVKGLLHDFTVARIGNRIQSCLGFTVGSLVCLDISPRHVPRGHRSRA